MNKRGEVIQLYDYKYAPSRQRKRGRFKKLLFRFLLAAILPVMFWFINSIFQVEKIEIAGLQQIERNRLVEAAGIKPGMSILLINEAKTAARILELPPVREVEIKKLFPSTVKISVTERIAEAYILGKDCYWAVDGTGVVYKQQDSYDGNLPLITGVNEDEIVPGLAVRCPLKGQALATFLDELKRVQLDIAELNFRCEDDLVLYTLEGLEVRLGESGNMGRKLALLQESRPYLDPDKSVYVDVRGGLRLVVVANSSSQ